MTNREAITLLDNATAQLSTNRETHSRIVDALKTLLVLVDDVEARAAIAAKKAADEAKPA